MAEPGLWGIGCDPVSDDISFGCRRWKSKGSLCPPLTSDSAKCVGIPLYWQLVTKGHKLSEEENQLIIPCNRAATVELKARVEVIVYLKAVIGSWMNKQMNIQTERCGAPMPLCWVYHPLGTALCS